MVKFMFGLAKAVVFVCGLAFCALFAAGFVAGFRAELARQAEAKSEIDALIAEFIAIKPRTTWPSLMSEVNDLRLFNNFVEGAREGGVELAPNQRELARKIIIPRIKEQMARTVEKFDANTEADEARALMAQDCAVFMRRYGPVIMALLHGTDPITPSSLL